MSQWPSIRSLPPPWRTEVKWYVCLGAVGAGLLAGAAASAVCRRCFSPSALELGGCFHIAASVAALAVLLLAPPRFDLAAKLGIGKLRRFDIKLALGGLLAVYAFELISLPPWGWLLRRLGVEFSEKQSLLDLCAGADVPLFIQLLILVGLVIPATEELFFRRLLFGVLCPLGVIPSLLLSSMIFGVLHWFIYGIFVLTFFGVVLGWIYLRTGNLAASILAHSLFNLVSLCVAFCMGGPR